MTSVEGIGPRGYSHPPLIDLGDAVDVLDVAQLLLGGPLNPLEIVFRLVSDVDCDTGSMDTIRRSPSDGLKYEPRMAHGGNHMVSTCQPTVIAEFDRQDLMLSIDHKIAVATATEAEKEAIVAVDGRDSSSLVHLPTHGRLITQIINLSACKARLDSARRARKAGSVAIDLPCFTERPMYTIRRPTVFSMTDSLGSIDTLKRVRRPDSKDSKLAT